MKNLASLLALALPLVVIGCGGARHQSADPRTSTAGDASPGGDAQSDGSNSDRKNEDSERAAVTTNSRESPSSLDSAIRSEVSGEPGLSPAAAKSSSASEKEAAQPAKNAAENETTQPTKLESSKNPTRSPSAGTVEQQDESGPEQCRESATGLALSVDRKTVSLEEGRLRAAMDGPICSLLMRITRKDGMPAIEKSFRYTAPEREMRWNPVPRDQIEKIEIRVSSKNGGFQSVFLIPWSVSIDHEEVQFDTNKAIIRDSEVASLNDSLTKINDVLAMVEDKGLGTITLFIAGHTDTQGSNEHNMALSRNRAQAIAGWFVKRGLCIPIAFDGFGETALKKLTTDNVDEQANRRVDYILSVEAPTIKKGAAPAWKWISKGC